MFEIKEITPAQATYIEGNNESHFFDVKSKQISPAKLSRTFSAFANADGGDAYIGIEEIDASTNKRAWDGFANPEEVNGHVQVLERIFPFSGEYDAVFLKSKGRNGYVLHINVRKSSQIRMTTEGKIYVRKNAQNLPVNSEAERKRLELDKGIQSYEDEFITITEAEVTNSSAIIEFALNIIPTAEPLEWLEKQQLMRSDGKSTVAGVLLFSDEPQIHVPKGAIKIYRYDTDESEGTRATLSFDPITIEGCLYRQIYDSVEKTKSIIERIRVMRDQQMTTVEYPTEALHEIITNAVIHRDYSLNDNVHVRIFNNRVEIQSPGRFPGHVTQANVLKARASRNHKIQRYLNKFPNPPNKDVGEGLRTAFQAMNALRLRKPDISQIEENVLVTLRHEKLAGHEETILDYLQHNQSIVNSKVREICNINSESIARKTLGKLVSSGKIEHVPGTAGRAYAYRIVSN